MTTDRPAPTTPAGTAPRRNTMNEAALERLFQERVRRAGGIALKLAPTHVGMPDRLVLLPSGRSYLVELKTETGRLSDVQRHFHARLARMTIPVVVLYGRDAVNEWCADRMRDYDEVTRKAGRKRKPREHLTMLTGRPPEAEAKVPAAER